MPAAMTPNATPNDDKAKGNDGTKSGQRGNAPVSPSAGAASSAAAAAPSNPTSAWKDLPRRLLTVGLGVPSIILLLRHPVTSWLFFQGAHLLCLVEWRALVPAAESDADEPPSDADAKDAPHKRSLQELLTKIFANPTSTTTPLSKRMFHLFCVTSILISILPTSTLPLVLMTYGITTRLIPHLPTFQSNPSNAMELQHYQFGLLYLSTGFHFILQISKVGGPIHIGNLLFIVWMSDTGALIVGRTMKRKKNHATTKDVRPLLGFLKSVSPGKSLPGLWGAVTTGPICALIYPIQLSSYSYDAEEQCDGEDTGAVSTIMRWISVCFHHPLLQKSILGFIIAIAGIVGDLAESSVKRMSRKKDSGRLLPGHGGVVDRFDSLFVAAALYYYWLLA